MKKLINRGFTLIELIMVTIILGILAAVAIPKYMATVGESEQAAEDAVISAMVSGLEIYATEKLIDSGRRYWPSHPFDALSKKPASYDNTDNNDADSDGEWTFNTSNKRITHMRQDGSKYYWSYDAGTNTESSVSNNDCWSGDYTNHDELMAAVENGFVVATQSATSETQCGDGETFFWCQQPGSSTDNYDYCGNNGYCPVNDVNGVACCYCGGCLVTVCPQQDGQSQGIGSNSNNVGTGIGARTAF